MEPTAVSKRSMPALWSAREPSILLNFNMEPPEEPDPSPLSYTARGTDVLNRCSTTWLLYLG